MPMAARHSRPTRPHNQFINRKWFTAISLVQSWKWFWLPPLTRQLPGAHKMWPLPGRPQLANDKIAALRLGPYFVFCYYFILLLDMWHLSRRRSARIDVIVAQLFWLYCHVNMDMVTVSTSVIEFNESVACAILKPFETVCASSRADYLSPRRYREHTRLVNKQTPSHKTIPAAIT